MSNRTLELLTLVVTVVTILGSAIMAGGVVGLVVLGMQR